MAADNRPQFDRTNTQAEPEQFHIGAELKDLEKDDKTRAFVIIGVVLAVIAIAVGVITYALRPKPTASGSIDEAYAVALPGDSVLATVQVTLRNVTEKPLWIRDLKAQLTTADGKQYSDSAASPTDFDRYFSGFPSLREHSLQPLRVETKLAPGQQIRGSLIFSYPVNLDAFNSRKSLAVIIQPYDQAQVTITK